MFHSEKQNKRKRKKSEVVRRLKRDFVVGVGGQQVGGEAGKAGGEEEGVGAAGRVYIQ